MTTNITHTGTTLKYLQAVFIIIVVLYFGRSLFVPLSYGLLIAIVLYPICKWLEQHGWPRSLAITVCLLIVLILFGAIISLLVIQVNVFRKDLPELISRVKPALLHFQQWVQASFGVSISSQDQLWNNAASNISSNVGNIAQNTLSATASTFFTLFITPVYAALFLYNRGAFVQFLEKITGNRYQRQLKVILSEVINTYFHFIKGMVMVYLIVGVLNSIGLLALGIRHAILFGMLTAIMTIIPYVGLIVSALLPISVALITKDSIWYPIGVIGVFTFVQYLEANIIFPKVVATQLKVSTWATLVAIFAGGLLWGVAGMILFIPFAGILKIVLDYIPSLKPINIVLGRD